MILEVFSNLNDSHQCSTKRLQLFPFNIGQAEVLEDMEITRFTRPT